ncbi:rhodanese-like domain-containing protein 8, chloroplastic isoform X2 [Henckelia pumila]|uniref:rhodanese-like domain-containing protein 8, chloroplastic isoform X2 n=1 Tax=Henckelia pumila TaxID=405737 RepID=UPI003C6E7B3D
MAKSCTIVTWTPFLKPSSAATSDKRTEYSSFNNGTRFLNSPLYSQCLIKSKTYVWGRFCCDFQERFSLSVFASTNDNWVEVEAAAPRVYEDDEFVVVNFYRFAFVEDPEMEVSKHLSFMQGRDIRGRIYLNEQGINAQYSGPAKDAMAYVNWVREDHRFSDILVQLSPGYNGHAFPKLRLRYKPALVQLEEGMSDLPLLDPSTRATPLTPSQWRSRLTAVNKIANSLNAVNNFILLDVRNGYEWDVGHFLGAQRPDVDCFKSTSLGLSESEIVAPDPLAAVDKEKTDILMYCTGGIRCDVYSTILRQRGFKNLYTLSGGVSHYLETEGSVGWVGNLFVFDGRLSLSPFTYKPEICSDPRGKQEVSHSFAKCYICVAQVSDLRHRNCANLDCNLLFLCCLKCVNDFRGCCCMNCMSASRLRPVLPGHRRYQKWHNYRDLARQVNLNPPLQGRT